MRTIAWCVLTLSLVGCQSGPRWFMRDDGGAARFEDQPVIESAPPPAATPEPVQPSKEGPNLSVPQPAQRERTPYESSSRSRGWFGNRTNNQASRVKSSSRTTSTARRSTSPAPVTKTAVLPDESVKQLMVDLEKVKRDKAALESKLTEESAKQTQQRLELEARLAVLQEQLRQQSALQQVLYQQQQASAVTNTTPTYSGPMISSGMPSPSIPYPYSSTKDPHTSTPQKKPLMTLETAVSSNYQMPKYQPQFQNSPPANNSASAWSNTAAGVWSNTATGASQQQPELWPYSPQRR